jgi:hypothetical protein
MVDLRGWIGGLGAHAINESYWRIKDHMLHSRIHFDRGDCLAVNEAGFIKASDIIAPVWLSRLTGTGSGLRLRLCRDHQFSY